VLPAVTCTFFCTNKEILFEELQEAFEEKDRKEMHKDILLKYFSFY